MVNVTFWGVRGSTPCPSEANARYGGNTACVSVEAPGMDPIVCDLGTGFRFFGEQVMANLGPGERFDFLALVTHLHWDHIQGLPFFEPIHRPETSMVLRGRSEGISIEDAFSHFMRPPFFPISAGDLMGSVRFEDSENDTYRWGRAVITAADVPHTGHTNGYRIELDGVVIAYISDHQQPEDLSEIAGSVLDLCRDADLVIHDAQYEPHEFAEKADWGHSTVRYAVQVAAAAGARRLALFHHDPDHDDATLDRIQAEATEMAAGTSLEEVFAAGERVTVSLSPAPAPLESVHDRGLPVG